MKWVIKLGEHDIKYHPRKTIIRQALDDFLVETIDMDEEDKSPGKNMKQI